MLEKQNDMISKQLFLFANNEVVYICAHSQEEYNKKIMQLLEQNPDPVAILLSADGPGDIEIPGDDDD